MKITHAEDSAQADNAIRGGERSFATLLTGDEGSLSNYKLSLVRQAGKLDIPRHKHNFDQIRMCLEGEPQNYGNGKWINAGDLVYFPEGTPYGPEQSESKRLSITLQFGGASGCGYVGGRRAKRCIEDMQKFGIFEGGCFIRSGELKTGQKRTQDSYEAIWEYANKRKIVYPKARFFEPIGMSPANFEWKPGFAQLDILRKDLATFSERDFSISILKCGDVAAPLPPRKNIQIGFVLSGEGAINDQPVRRHSAFSLSPYQACKVLSGGGLEVLVIALHAFDEEASA